MTSTLSTLRRLGSPMTELTKYGIHPGPRFTGSNQTGLSGLGTKSPLTVDLSPDDPITPVTPCLGNYEFLHDL